MFHRSSSPALRVVRPLACAAALLLSRTPLLAEPVSPAPALPAPVGTVINVSTEPQLQAAMAQMRSNTTIVLAPGTYRLTQTLYFNGAFSHVGLRGATNNPDDVVILGPGMTNAAYGEVPFGVWTGGGVQDITVANLTIRDFYFHPIILNAGTRRPLLHNLHLIDAGEQFVKGNADANGGVDEGVLEYTTIEFTNRARDTYPEGIDIHTGRGWQIRHNLFRNLRAPGATQLLGPAVLMWNRSRDTIVEGNTFINCQREIMFGVEDRTPDDHTGGLIRNNMIYRAPGIFSDVAIGLWDSPGTQVLNNTIVLSGNFPNAIEYRYPNTTNVYIANNLADAAITQRNDAQAVLHNNVLTASPALLVAAAAGDLHLRADAAAAIDKGTVAAGTTIDWDGDQRPQGAAPDVGADEFRSTTEPPTTPPPTTPPPTGRVNVALASAGATATASSAYGTGFAAAAAIDGDRRGTNWGQGGGWHDASGNQYPDWLQVDFGGARTIDTISVVTVQDAYQAPVEPTETSTFAQYGITDYQVQYWDGAQWQVVPGGAISGNRQVLRTVTFTPLTTSRIRVLVTASLTGFSRITEVEAYQSDGAAPPTTPPPTSPPPTGRVNVALASAGATATASSAYGTGFAAAAAIDGDRRGTNWGQGGGWHDASGNQYPDWLQVDFGGARTIDTISVATVQDAYQAPVEPTETLTFAQYGITDYQVQYWDGAQWQVVPGGAISGNRQVLRTVTFTPLTTSRIRVLVTASLTGFSRITEVEAYQSDGAAPPTTPPPTNPPPTGRVNVALASAGATATASSAYGTGFAAAAAINGDRRGTNWGQGGGWHDASGSQYPDWLQVDFGGARTIDTISVVTVQDAYQAPVEPTETLTFVQYGITDYQVQYWDGAQWQVVPGGAISGNRQVLRTVTFTPLTTTRIRVWITGALSGYSRIAEVEAYASGSASSPVPVNVAAASAGATASVSSAYGSAFGPAGVNDGDRKGLNWGSGGGWNDGTGNSFPDWLQIDFAGSKTIGEVRVFTVQDNYSAPVEPAATLTFANFGVTSFLVQYWDGSQWLTVPGGTITGNRNVWRTITFPAITTARIRVLVTDALTSFSRLVEVEAY